jgi:hypothetical protein
MITFEFNDTKFQARFGTIMTAAKNPRAILMNSGREVGNQLKKHFREKDQTDANTLAPDRRSHFWLAVAQMVQNPVQENPTTISVSINHPDLAQKVFGGPIFAKEAGALTIPESPEAYGRTTHTFEQETGLKLFLIHSGDSDFEKALLVVKDESGRGFTVEYLLTPSVDQKADTTALPDKSLLEAAVLSRAQRVLDRQLEEDKPNPDEEIP